MTHSDSLSALSPEDRRLFHEYGLGKRVPLSFTSLVEAFQIHAQSTPSSTAVHYLNESITYGELDRQSSELAARLGGLGVRSGHRVVLLVKRSISMVIGILGILKTGAAYVPLDGGIVTDSTLAHIITDADVKVVLTLRAFTSRVETLAVTPLLLDEPWSTKEVNLYSAHTFTGQESAYIVYTSGTTGTPKGVDVSHRNVLNLITQHPGNLGMRPGLKVSQLLNIAFDMAQWECLGALSNGCTLCLRGSDWLETLRTVDVVISTPSCLRKFTPSDFKPQAIATAGEPCPQILADRWVAGRTRFFNCCGPTEAINTVHEHSVEGRKLSIGSPTPNNNVYILDENMRAVPIGVPGMIWAGGLGVAKGYLNLPERTAESFRYDVFTNDGSMMYKTGDLGQWRTDGSGLLDILGRNDDQVKVKGFRVELDGVAAAMETAPGIQTAVALLVDDDIVGVYAPDTVAEEIVRAACAKIQPYYACPSRYIKLPEMPTTSNGKTDRKQIRAIASCSSSTNESVSSDASSDSSTCPSSESVASDEDCEPHIFSSITKLSSEDVSPILWETPSSFIPTRGAQMTCALFAD
ncbi:amino acid adenylation domain-containing protein [Rhizoctonia solani]|nr:amino acid adenylation domain-containing protein [Rhizoctonia solani]